MKVNEILLGLSNFKIKYGFLFAIATGISVICCLK